jgi:ADP-heptose:LPS heptosyltransferase
MLNLNFKAHLLKFFTKKHPVEFDVKNSKNVVFLRYDRIGDMVITTPVFRELKRTYPHINVIVIASKINRCILENNPFIDEVIINYKNNLLGDLLSLLKLRGRNLDVCVEFDHSVIPHAILRLRIINPKKIISVYKDGRYGVPGKELLMYDYFTKMPKNAHFRDVWLSTLEPFGVISKSNEYDIFCSDIQNNNARRFLGKYTKKILIGINLEGAVKGKKIQYTQLQEICKGLYKFNKNIQIIILSSPSKRVSVQKQIVRMDFGFVTLSYKTKSIIDAAAIIRYLHLIITPDTSIVHIASAFNKSIISIHEDNLESYNLFAPTSEINKTIFSESKDSLQDFSVDSILEAARELLNIEGHNNFF